MVGAVCACAGRAQELVVKPPSASTTQPTRTSDGIVRKGAVWCVIVRIRLEKQGASFHLDRARVKRGRGIEATELRTAGRTADTERLDAKGPSHLFAEVEAHAKSRIMGA